MIFSTKERSYFCCHLAVGFQNCEKLGCLPAFRINFLFVIYESLIKLESRIINLAGNIFDKGTLLCRHKKFCRVFFCDP